MAGLQVFAGDKIQHNERAVDYCRTIMAIVSGMLLPYAGPAAARPRPCRERTRVRVRTFRVRAHLCFRASTSDAARTHARSTMVHVRLRVWHFGVQGPGGPAGARPVSVRVHAHVCIAVQRLCGGVHT